MKTNTHQEMAEAFIHTAGYLDDERVRAIFLVGSSASGSYDAHSDVDIMVVIAQEIPDEERLALLRAIGCRNIMLAIAGVANPALPVNSQVIDKFVFHDTWFDVSYHLPHQLEFCFDYVTLLDRDDFTPQLCMADQTHTEDELKTRAQADLRLLHARIHRYDKYVQRQEWIGLDLSAIKNLAIDVVMLLNEQPNYNRYSSRISDLLHDLRIKPDRFEQTLEDILHLDNREEYQRKIEMLNQLETDLTRLCQERWGAIAMFDDQDAAT